MVKIDRIRVGACSARTLTSEEGALVRWCSHLEGVDVMVRLVC